MKKVKQKDSYRAFIRLLVIVLIVAIVANVAYAAFLLIRRSAHTNELSTVTDTTVSRCMEILEQFNLDEIDSQYVDLYMGNMEAADTVLEKAYVANTFLTFAYTTANRINSENITEVYNQNQGTPTQAKTAYVNELSSLTGELQQAIYEYTIYDEG